MALELMAQAAAVLAPGRVVVGFRDVHAVRWLALDRSTLAIRIVAERRDSDAPGDVQEISVRIEDAEDRSVDVARSAFAYAIVRFARSYPGKQVLEPTRFAEERGSSWESQALYTTGMFHGPRFQGVTGVERCGSDGIAGALKVLPLDQLVDGAAATAFLTDPALLDAAGQLVGYWTMETQGSGVNVFPFHVATIDLHGAPLPPGMAASAVVRTELVQPDQVRAQIDIVDSDGTTYAKITDWDDRRFELPAEFLGARIQPRKSFVSSAWSPAGLLDGLDPGVISFRIVDSLSMDFLDRSGQIWLRVLAHLVLSRSERSVWRELATPTRRRVEWLLGRVAAKDAVRDLLLRRHGLIIAAADVEITADELGKPVASSTWAKVIGAPPVVSISHSAGVAAALAAEVAAFRDVGLDIEAGASRHAGFEDGAFTSDERAVLGALGTADNRWPLRAWCAKEAVGKALGEGLGGGPGNLAVRSAVDGQGRLNIAVQGDLARRHPELEGRDRLSANCPRREHRRGGRARGAAMSMHPGAATRISEESAIRDGVVRILAHMTSDWDLELSGGIGSSTRLVEDLGFESMDVTMFVVALQDAFGRRDLPFEMLLMRDGRYVEDLDVATVVGFLADNLVDVPPPDRGSP